MTNLFSKTKRIGMVYSSPSILCKKGWKQCVCKQCERDFKVWKSQPGIFCSHVCRSEFQVGRKGHWRGKKRANMSNVKNPNWGGEKVGYGGIHIWLVKKYGRPNECEFCGTTVASRFEWAKKQDCKYERKRENFIRLCKKCHNDYDGVNIWQQK